jgi:hypothetical protein
VVTKLFWADSPLKSVILRWRNPGIFQVASGFRNLVIGAPQASSAWLAAKGEMA